MLTASLIRVRVQGKDIRPSFVDPSDERQLDRAAELVEVFDRAEAEGWSRAEVEAACKEVEGDDRDHKLVKGLAKVLLDKCDFETTCPVDPQALRMAAFLRAAEVGPLSRRASATGRPTAADVLREVAAASGPLDDDARPDRWIYADLKDEQRLSRRGGPRDAQALLHRYNVALVQAVLLRASELTVRIAAPDPKRVRQLFRHLKFHQLMFRAHTEDEWLVLQVDGPQSLLASSTRYGLQLATFFPAILLVEAEWRLEAEIRWGKRGLRKDLVLDSSLELRTHYRDTGAWQSRTEQFLLERWETADTDGWELMPGELLDLGGQRIVVPDLKLEKEGRVAWLDIVGYWRARWLKDHLDGTPDHVIVAASRRLVGDRKGGVPKRLEHRCVPFAEVIPVKDLLACAERVAVRP